MWLARYAGAAQSFGPLAFLLAFPILFGGAVAAQPVVPVRPIPAASSQNSLHSTAPYQEALRRSGVAPTPAGAVQYLRELQPSEDRQAVALQLIAELGHNDYAMREKAMKRLLRMPLPPLDELTRAVAGNDAEVRWRAEAILNSYDDSSSQLLHAALQVIAAEPPADCLSDLFLVAPLCRLSYLQIALQKAVEAAVGPNDQALAIKNLSHEHPRVRVAAVAAIVKIRAAETELLHPLLADESEEVVLQTARSIANQGDRTCLPAFIRLLDSDDARIRSQSSLLLESLTARRGGFAAYDQPEHRAKAIAGWRSWLQEEGAAAELHFPLVLLATGRGDLAGNTLISTGNRNIVAELDPAGQTVWSYKSSAWSAEKLPSGHVLIASYTANHVIEVDRAGKVVWEFPSINAMTARPLANGNILIADFNGRRAVEVDRDKKTVWEQKTPDECFDVDRLADGNTLFGCPNVVQIVSPDHRVVHEWKISGRLNGVQGLASGNILVANYGENKVVELSPEGKVVWELAETQPCDAYRLPTGRTLISTSARIIEVEADGTLVKQWSEANYGSARQ